MSTLAVEAPIHRFGYRVVGPMARQLDTWAPDSHHARYYPQELRRPGLRLPPPSSLVAGGQPDRPPFNNSESEGRYVKDSESLRASFSERRTPPRMTIPAGAPYATASSVTRYREDLPPRLSPAYSSTASDRSEEIAENSKFRHFVREQNVTYLPRIQPPTRSYHDHSSEAFQASADSYQSRPTLVQKTRDFRPDYLSDSTPSPNRLWSPSSDTRPPEMMKISELLSGEPRPNPANTHKAPMVPLSSPAPTHAQAYTIVVRQQPAAARSCGFGERDRRVIDPPPIVQLKIDDPDTSPEQMGEKFRNMFAVMHCTIWSESGDADCSLMPEDFRQQRRLMGSLAASSFVGMDENGEEGSFFCFPDLSCRTPGSFRLKFALLILDPNGHFPGSKHRVRAEVMSNVFTVYNAKDFPGMQASTALTKKLKEQGCLISIKKGNEKGTSRHDRDDSDDDYDDEDGSAPGNKRKKQRK